ncbi:anti-sigma factor [Humibacter antri]
MSSHGDTDHPEDVRLLSAGYALGSLTRRERAEYERWLERGGAARAEASEFAEVVTMLNTATPATEPPAALKTALMARIAVTPQTRPIIAGHDQRETTEAVAAPALARPELEHESVGTGFLEEAQEAAPVKHGLRAAQRKAQRRWFTRPLAMVAAAAAAVVLVAGGATIGVHLAQHPQHSVQADALASITSAADAQHATVKVTGGGTATLVWSASRGKSAIVVDAVRTAPAGKTYQLWYIRDGHATSAGFMTGNWQVLNGQLQHGDVVGMTLEPAGGSAQPTTNPIVAIST